MYVTLATLLKSDNSSTVILFSTWSQERLISFEYHLILCWISTEASFSWRHYTKDGILMESRVHTKEAFKISKTLMNIAQGLVEKFELSGIKDEELEKVKSVIFEDPENAISYLKQISLSRLFSIRQAGAILELLREVSAFDMVGDVK